MPREVLKTVGTCIGSFKTASIGQLDLLSHSLRRAGKKSIRIGNFGPYWHFLGLFRRFKNAGIAPVFVVRIPIVDNTFLFLYK